MPIYEFQCENCGNPFEELVFGNAIDKVRCPECESDQIHKLISTFASKIAGGGSLNLSSASSCSTGSV